MNIHIEETTGIRRASARMREAGVIHVRVPRHWPRKDKQRVIAELVARVKEKDSRQKALLAKQAARQPRLHLKTEAALIEYVHRLNAETLQAPVGKIRIGRSKSSHLAQVNLRTKVMTVSRYCLDNVPAEAFRYLIIHELAHYFEPGHNRRFWSLVERHVPDYRLQSRIMKAFHHQAVLGEASPEEPAPLPAPPTETGPLPVKRPGFFEQLRLPF